MPSTRKIKKENNEVDDEEAENPETESKKQSFIVKDPTQWLFFTKDEVIKPDPNKNNETVVCGLRHPRTDGSIFLTTQVDPVFLILPYLIKAAQSEKFMTLDQTVCDDDFPECQRLQSCCQPELLEHVADVKGDDDFKVYRFNKDKTLSWLKLKTENVCKVLERKNICVSGAKTSELIQSKATEDEYMRYAYGIVSDYLSTEMSSALREHLGIPVVTEKRPSDAKNPPSKRAKLEDITPSEDYSSNVKQDDKSNKGKQTTAQKKLEKVDKSGMKSMMSFFSPKTKS
ncbi:ribonuclease H2 subunit B-like isoform X3 [Mercenaria mercenaria]|uniref:ribonuclease H2 subunit B-like isoform X3 n=1 Tax=Mercenaria mercenaria TaxID=6596 RepID=UPI001E1D30AB|nr:ribonuclease H2 subunit B-like isoform X3 [Mercenaria mercenaria]